MNLSEYLAQSQFAKTKYARVTCVLGVDTGRSGQTTYAFRILAPKKITNLMATSSDYTFAIVDGNPLNPDVAASAIEIKMALPEKGAQFCGLSFDLVLDGKPLADGNGAAYVFAVQQDGPRTVRDPLWGFDNPGVGTVRVSNEDSSYNGPRLDLHPGNEFEDADNYAYYQSIPGNTDVWVRSTVANIDIALIDPGATSMTTKEVYNQGSFSSS